MGDCFVELVGNSFVMGEIATDCCKACTTKSFLVVHDA